MSNDTNPYPGTAGTEPTVPLGQSQGYAQSDGLGMEPTMVDPFGASPRPDFGYDGLAGSPEQRADQGFAPDPRPASPHPARATAPLDGSAQPGSAELGYAEPDYTEPRSVPPVQTVYQPYPAPSTPPAAPLAPRYPPQAYGFAQLPEHPSAIPSLVLGLVGLILAIPFASPIAWYLGFRGLKESRLQPGRWRTSGLLTAGLILGIVGTVIWGFFVALMILAMIAGA